MHAVKNLLDKYGQADSALDALGEFNDPGLQALYDSLTSTRTSSSKVNREIYSRGWGPLTHSTDVFVPLETFVV